MTDDRAEDDDDLDIVLEPVEPADRDKVIYPEVAESRAAAETGQVGHYAYCPQAQGWFAIRFGPGKKGMLAAADTVAVTPPGEGAGSPPLMADFDWEGYAGCAFCGSKVLVQCRDCLNWVCGTGSVAIRRGLLKGKYVFACPLCGQTGDIGGELTSGAVSKLMGLRKK